VPVPKTRPGFSASHVLVFLCSVVQLRWVMIVRFVDIGGNVDRHFFHKVHSIYHTNSYCIKLSSFFLQINQWVRVLKYKWYHLFLFLRIKSFNMVQKYKLNKYFCHYILFCLNRNDYAKFISLFSNVCSNDEVSIRVTSQVPYNRNWYAR
jgi:hypothetical protein